MTKTAIVSPYSIRFGKERKSIADTLDQHGQALVELSEEVTKIRNYQEQEKKYREDKEHQRIYFVRHKEENWLMLGYTNNLARRLKEHKSKGWEYVGDQVGTQQGLEKLLLDSIRAAGFKSIPTSNEVFKISEPFIEFLICKQCDGITKDLLRKDTQKSLSLV